MPWRYAEPPYTSMPSYRMTDIRFAIGGIGAGAGRQRRRPLHRSISRHSGHPVTSPSTTPPADEYHAASDGQQHDQPADRDAPVADRPCWFCRPPCWPCGTSVLSSSDSLGSVGSVGLPGSIGLLGSVGSVGPSLALHGDRALGGGRVAGLVYVSTYSPGFAASTEPDTLTASVTSPSTSSVADTPANGSNSESCSTVTSSTPESTGAIVSAGGTGFF